LPTKILRASGSVVKRELILHEGADNEAGQLSCSIASQLESLWVFLEENGVEPTNKRSERALRLPYYAENAVTEPKAKKETDGSNELFR
jgi:hypothetical protein